MAALRHNHNAHHFKKGAGNPAAEPHVSFKLLFIGDPSVGKSTLARMYRDNAVNEEVCPPTVGFDFFKKAVVLEDGKTNVELNIWDTAGLEANRHCLTPQFYRGADGVIITYDITDFQSFHNVSDVWLREQKQYLPSKNVVLALVGNKLDQDAARKVTTEEGLSLAHSHNMTFVELSAFEENGLVKLQDLMVTMARDMMHVEKVGSLPPSVVSRSSGISLGWEVLDVPIEPVPKEVYEQQDIVVRQKKNCSI